MLWFEQSWLVLLVDVSIKPLVLAILAATLLAIFRVRNANVRHRVWTSVLFGMLALPLLVPITPTVPLPAWLTPEFPTAVESGVSDVSTVDSIPVEVHKLDDEMAEASGPGPFTETGEFEWDLSNDFPAIEDAASTARIMQDDSEAAAEPGVAEGEAKAKPSVITWLLANSPTAVCVIYLTIAGGFVFRVLLGLIGTYRVVHRSHVVEIDRKLGTLAKIHESDELSVPLIVGFLRPTILLPNDWPNWGESKLQAVLAHESEHIRRGDYLVTLLGEINRAIHWFHPLSWWLRCWLSDLAEQNCDDAVIASTGERAQYARHLLEVAGSLRERRGRLAWSGVAMARRANVETRIDAILDPKRPLARHIGLVGALLLIATSVPAILLAAALRPGQPMPDKEAAVAAVAAYDLASSEDVDSFNEEATAKLAVPEPKAAGEEAAVDNATPKPAAKGPKGLPLSTVSGKVIGPAGKPFPNATVFTVGVKRIHRTSPYFKDWGGEPRIKHIPIAETKSAADGSYSLFLGPPDNEELNRLEILVVAYAEGYGSDWARDVHLLKNPNPILQLPRDTPIIGRVLDLEGRPIKGVNLSITRVKKPESDQAIVNWIKSERPDKYKDEDYFENDMRFTSFPVKTNSGELSHGSRTLPHDVTTGPDGRFQFSGIGRNRLVILEASAPSIAKQNLSIVTREMRTIKAKPRTFLGTPNANHYGAKVNFVARPTQPILGKVVDLETKEPLAGMQVIVSTFSGSITWQGDFLSATTDADGHFRIVGAPQGGGHRLEILPPLDQPYFATTHRLPAADGLDPVTCSIELRKGTWLTGKVLDQPTQEPIDATLHYYPFVRNKYAEGYSNFVPGRRSVPDDHIVTDEDGSFRILVIPGAGVLGVRVTTDGDRYGSHIPQDLLERMGGERAPKLYHSWSASWFHAIHDLDVEANVDAVRDAMTVILNAGLSRTIEIVDDLGQPLTGVQMIGRTNSGFMEKPLKDARVEVVGLKEDEQREIILLHKGKNLGKVAKAASGNKPVVIKLERCATVSGRVLDDEDQPVSNREIRLSPLDADKLSGRFGGRTDDKGRFIVHLPVGLTYVVRAYSSVGPNFSATVEAKTVVRIDLGDLHDGDSFDETETALLAEEKALNPIRRQTVADLETADAPRPPRGLQPGAVGFQAVAAVETKGAEPDDSLVYEAQVLTPNGKPAVGADVYLEYWYKTARKDVPPKRLAVTDANGRFRFARKRSKSGPDQDSGTIVAKLDGYGFAWAFAPALETTGVREAEMKQGEHYGMFKEMLDQDRGPMRLVADDTPITGRVIDLEGNGIGGAKISVLEVAACADNSLEAWTKAANDPKADYFQLQNIIRREIRRPHAPALLGKVVTDADGRFTIRGIGRNRLAKLGIEGKNMEAVEVYARTMAGEKLELPFQRGRTDYWKMTYYGSKVQIVASPSKPVVGTVVDEQGIPVPGVVVTSSISYRRSADGTNERAGSDVISAITDARGRYRLDGLPRASMNTIQFVSAGKSHMPLNALVDTRGNNIKPVEKNVKLKIGIVVEGQVTDAKTGAAVVSWFRFLPEPAKEQTKSGRVQHGKVNPTDQEGKFRILLPPVAGKLCVTASDREAYQYVANPATVTATPEFMVLAAGGRFHAIQQIEPKDGERSIQLNLQLTPASVIVGTVVDGKGNPLSRFHYVGRGGDDPRWTLASTRQLKVFGYDDKKPRLMGFYHRGKKLAGIHLLKSSAAGNFPVTLQPWATIKGRIVDTDGDPLVDVLLEASNPARRRTYPNPMVNVDFSQFPLPLPPTSELGNSRHVTGKNGRFEIFGLATGHNYEISGRSEGKTFRDTISNVLLKDLTLKPGETRDLGDITLRNPARRSNGQRLTKNLSQAQTKPIALEKEDKITVLQGRIVTDGSNELPLDLKFFKARVNLGNETSKKVFLPLSSIKPDGSFSVEMTNLLSQVPHELPTDRWIDAGLFATAKGFGIAWFYPQDRLADSNTTQLRLVRDDVPIRGRVLDTEGRPVVGARATVARVYIAPEESLTGFLAGVKLGTVFQQVRSKLTRSLNIVDSHQSPDEFGISSSRTDEDGNFTINGIGRERLAMIYVEGRGVQRQRFFITTRDMTRIVTQPRGQAEPETVYGAKCTLVTSRGLTIEGVVLDADTKQPLAGVLIRDSTLNNVSGAHTPNFKATTDTNGRYRIGGFPTTGLNRLMAVPNDEQPYFIRDAVVQDRSKPGDVVVTLDFELHRGIWIKGRITEQESGKPVKAVLRYLPLLSNEYARDIPEVNGPGATMHSSRQQHRYQSKSDGTFRLVGLPGPAIVGVDAYGPFLTGVGADRIDGIDEDGEFATYSNPVSASLNLHALIEIDPHEDEKEVVVNFELRRGAQEQIHVVDEKGMPIWGTHVSGLHPTANYFPQKHWLPTMQVVSLGPHEKRRVLIQHRGRNLAAITEVVADESDQPRKVQLKKAAGIQGRLVSASGDPIDGITIEAQTMLIRNVVQMAKATTDEKGNFSIDSIPGPHDYRLQLVRFDGRLPEEVRQQKAEPGQTVTLGTLQVQ